MKLLIGLSDNLLEENSSYEMCIIDTDIIPEPNSSHDNWKKVNLDELSQCVNVKVDVTKFQSLTQNPAEYISADFDVEKLIGWKRNHNDFQITNVYYDEKGEPQLYRVVNSDGYMSIHDISEYPYREANNLYGKSIEELPDFVKKEPLSAAYEWWKEKDEKGKKSESRFFSGQFETNERMPVKLLYHYLVGVKGFKVGYHTQTEITEDYKPEIHHEYFLYKDTANIKLRESVPLKKEKDAVDLFDRYVMFDENGDLYPGKRKLGYYGATMSMICNRENYPKFDIYSGPSSQCQYDKDGIAISIDGRKNLMHIYNKLEESGCISKDWRLGEYNSFFGSTDDALLPEELALLSTKLQSEKTNTRYCHAVSIINNHWSMLNTDQWIKVSSIAAGLQFYSPELREKLNPIFEKYKDLYMKELCILIEEMGAKDALETMKWTKESSKEVLKTISLVKNDGSLQKADIDVVDQMRGLYTYKRNNYPLPEWLQIYSPETIEILGGVELIQRLISKRGEEFAKESLPILAEVSESERKHELRNQEKRFVKPEDFIVEETPIIESKNQVEGISAIRR